MAVDLSDLIDSFKREVAVPGDFATVFPNMSDDDIVGVLSDGFWEAKFDGIVLPWTVSTDGIVTPISAGGDDLPRDLQQVIVFYAGMRTVRNALRATNTSFRTQAGSVLFETQQSANALRDLFKWLADQRKIILTRLSDLGIVKSIYIDGAIARTFSIGYGDTFFID